MSFSSKIISSMSVDCNSRNKAAFALEQFSNGHEICCFSFFSFLNHSCCIYNCCVISGPEKKCEAGEFQCNNGNCIPMKLVCNKVSECSDDSDEPLHCNVDECAKVELHQCGHKCINTIIGFECACNTGYK